jgi:hypothetical protein
MHVRVGPGNSAHMESNNQLKARLDAIDELLEPFIDGHGRPLDPLAAAVHELLQVVKELADQRVEGPV